MIHVSNLKYAVVLKQQSATNAATLTSDNIDVMNYDYCSIVIHGTTSDAATNKPSVLKVQESATTDASNFADVAALVGGGASGFTVPNSPTATTTAPFAILNVDTRYRKRYLRVLISPVTTQTFSAIALLARAGQTPVGTTDQNCAVIAAG